MSAKVQLRFRYSYNEGIISVSLSSGRVNQKWLPCPTVLSTPIVPPTASTHALQIAKPRPVLPCARAREEDAKQDVMKL